MASKRSADFVFTGSVTKNAGVLQDENILTGFFFPSGWATADVTFEASYDGTNYFAVKKSDGAAVTLTACVASTFVAITPGEMAWAGLYLKLVSSVTQTDKTVIGNVVRIY